MCASCNDLVTASSERYHTIPYAALLHYSAQQAPEALVLDSFKIPHLSGSFEPEVTSFLTITLLVRQSSMCALVHHAEMGRLPDAYIICAIACPLGGHLLGLTKGVPSCTE